MFAGEKGLECGAELPLRYSQEEKAETKEWWPVARRAQFRSHQEIIDPADAVSLSMTARVGRACLLRKGSQKHL
jgi:hypothetical protein